MTIYDKLYKRIQTKLKEQGKEVDLKVIEKCFRYQFEFIRKTFEDGDWYGVRLKYFGSFGVKTNRVKYTNKLEVREQVLNANKGDIVKVKTPSGKNIDLRVF